MGKGPNICSNTIAPLSLALGDSIPAIAGPKGPSHARRPLQATPRTAWDTAKQLASQYWASTFLASSLDAAGKFGSLDHLGNDFIRPMSEQWRRGLQGQSKQRGSTRQQPISSLQGREEGRKNGARPLLISSRWGNPPLTGPVSTPRHGMALSRCSGTCPPTLMPCLPCFVVLSLRGAIGCAPLDALFQAYGDMLDLVGETAGSWHRPFSRPHHILVAFHLGHSLSDLAHHQICQYISSWS